MDSRHNLPPWPRPDDHQTTIVREVLLEHDGPIPASEIAAFFREGEEILPAVLAALQLNAELGHARCTPKGWEFIKVIGSGRAFTTRPYGEWRIDQLEALYDKHCKADEAMTESDWSALERLLVELGHRKRWKANKLRDRVRGRLAVVGRPKTQGVTSGDLFHSPD